MACLGKSSGGEFTEEMSGELSEEEMSEGIVRVGVRMPEQDVQRF